MYPSLVSTGQPQQDSGGDSDSEDQVLQTLRKALAYAETGDESLHLRLAIELRSHMLSTIRTQEAAMQRLQDEQQRALSQHQVSQETQDRDHHKLALAQQPRGGPAARLLGLSGAARKRDAQDALRFSELMVERSAREVSRCDDALREQAERFGRELGRLRVDFDTMQAQQKFQLTVPRQHLIPIEPHTNYTHTTDDSALLDHVQRLIFDTHLWTSIHAMLATCISEISRPALIPGKRGHGADAYISLTLLNGSEIRIPIATIATFTNYQRTNVQRSSNTTASNSRAIRDIFSSTLLSTGYDARIVESSIKKLVLLISTETKAKNSGILVSIEGMLFVQRKSTQGVRVSRLVRFDTVKESEWNCHPVAAIGHFAQCVIA
ncbi:hypothetical protein FB639_003231, partial [Coemansia asiatica]